jgi:DNA-binding NarL/FixJ family response regulator
MRLLSDRLDISQIEVVDGYEYPATEFSPAEQARALKIVHDFEDSENAPLRTLGPEVIQTYLMHLADRIEQLTMDELAEAGYEMGETQVTPQVRISPKDEQLNDSLALAKERQRKVRKARIVVAQGHMLMLEALKGVLEPEFRVVGTFDDGRALVDGAAALRPDLIILEVQLPGENGLIAGKQLKTVLPEVKLVYLTMYSDPDLAAEAFRIGASAYVLKDSTAFELKNIIQEVLLGGYYVTPTIRKGKDSSSEDFKRRMHQLTERQKEVLRLLAEGRSMKEVALILNVTPKTVAFHKYALMERLKLKTVADLTQFAIKNLRLQS